MAKNYDLVISRVQSYSNLELMDEKAGVEDNLNATKVNEPTGLELWLNNRNMFVLVEDVGEMSNITSFCVSSNNLSSLPEYFKNNFPSLLSLDLEHNRFIKMPPCIFALTQLEHLNMAFNSIKTVPTEIASLSRMESLMLHNNPIMSVDPAIRRLTQLYDLSLDWFSYVNLYGAEYFDKQHDPYRISPRSIQPFKMEQFRRVIMMPAFDEEVTPFAFIEAAV